MISANVSISKLKDPWSFDSRGFLAGLFLLMLVPASLVASFFYEDYSKNSTARDEITAATAYTGSRPADSSTAGGPEQVELPSCSSPPANGSRLGGILKKLRGVHTLEIENGSSGDAIVNLRDAATNKLIYSFFVQKGKHAVVKKIPDGSYKIQYAIGDGLGQDCKTLLNKSANQFPAIQDFVTRKQDMGNYNRIGYSVLSYTLYSVPGGNVRPEAINPAEFDN
ncbi:hypothetical protein [Sandarakinorhabdus sp.]|uniref:hypothetical protein n=1 Tax=Sandarakinorhabdus sp. TaxID=1916663 RepID=UPI00356A9152